MFGIKREKILILINAALIIIWCGFIFYLSSKTAPQSNSQSKPVADKIVRTLDKIEGKNSPEPVLVKKTKSLNDLLRDYAHSACYFILAFLAINLLYLLKLKKAISVFLTVIFCSLYALSDEIHQLFVPGRAFQISDIVNDVLGAVLALIIYIFIRFVTKKYFSKGVL